MKACVASVFAIWGVLGCLLTPAAAQVVLDGTIGPSGERALSGPQYIIRESYGERAGANLFHSLRILNLEADEVANFTAASDIDNIVARVTGGASRIDGTLRSTLSRSGLLSNANLYLLNPSGVVFGPNARLDLGGSFHVSTADYLRMGGNDRFYAQPVEGEMLSSAAPQAFGFLSDTPAGIRLEGGGAEGPDPGLRVKRGETISVVGGDVRIEGVTAGGASADRLATPEGRINIAGVASPGEVGPTDTGLTVPEQQGDVAITDGAVLVTSGQGSGDIYIRGGAFLMENSTILADNLGDADGGIVDIRADTITLDAARIFSDNQSPDAFGDDAAFGPGNGGDIYLSADDTLEMVNDSRVLADTKFQGDAATGGRAGSLTLSATHIRIAGESLVASDTEGTGDGGRVTLRASESIDISTRARLFSGALGETDAAGDGGNIVIQTPRFTMHENARINTDTQTGGARGGDVLIEGLGGNPADAIHVVGSQIFAGAVDGQGETAGAGGRVTLTALDIRFTEGARIGSESLGAGRGGDVTLDASGGTIRFNGANADGHASRVLTTAESTDPDAGDAGGIVVRADALIFEDSGGITASTRGPGNAGTIEVSASRLQLTTGGSITSSSDSTGAGGNAGTIVINASTSADLTGDGSVISTETRSRESETDGVQRGRAGDIHLTTARLGLSDGAAITSASRNPEDGGDAGTIRIDASETLSLNGHGTIISTETAGRGLAGDIHAEAGALTVEEGAAISSASRNPEEAGNAGTITIGSSGDIRITDGGEVTTEAVNAGGGRMTVSSDGILFLENGRITTSVQKGAENGGDIDATARFIILKNGQIIAKAFEGRGGNIRLGADQLITTPDSVISASSELGIDGDIFIESPVTDISSILAVLPDQFLDAGQWIVKSCAERAVETAGRFIVREREGVPTPVDDWLASPF